MDEDVGTTGSLTDVAANEFNFSPDLLLFIKKSGKCVANLFTDIYNGVFGEVPVPTCHIVPTPDRPGSYSFYHSLDVGVGTVVGATCTKKKDSKLDCMKRALQILYDEHLGTQCSLEFKVQFGMESAFSELVKQAVRAKFEALIKENPRLWRSEKVIAGIVMFNSWDRSMQVISIATGNKGIRSCFLSTQGAAVHDCHAEILARRGFLRFLYGQVIAKLKGDTDTIFTDFGGKLHIRDNLTFHLYINTAPCGDARLYGYGSSDVVETDRNSGKLRFKIDKGMGAVLGTEDDNPYYNPQTIDGLLIGERLKTMSCTDKILRWNYLGLQGSLLGHFVQPIYLSSVVIGDAKNTTRIQRGIDSRLTGIPSHKSYSHHSPFVSAGQGESAEQTTSNSNLAANWNISDDSVELLDTTKGLTLEATPSRLCKRQLGILFKAVSTMLDNPVPADYSYHHIKLANMEHRAATETFYEWVRSQSLGYWHNKPEECEAFSL